MIDVAGLEYAYANGEAVLNGVSLSIGRGQLVGLVGANGSGKSTLMALMAGLYLPTAGTLSVDGNALPESQKAVRSLCRLVMQDADLQILGSTVEEDLLLGRKRSAESEARARSIAARFRLAEHWDSPVHSLSWGMKRKLCLAAALLDDPQVLLLDEPFSGLDYPGIREMRTLLTESRDAGLTQVVSSHDLECLVDLVDALVVMDNGELVLQGRPAEVLDHIREHGVRPPSRGAPASASDHGMAPTHDGSGGAMAQGARPSAEAGSGAAERSSAVVIAVAGCYHLLFSCPCGPPCADTAAAPGQQNGQESAPFCRVLGRAQGAS